MDCHGRMLAHVLLHESDGIVSMSWNCPDFLVEDSTESDTDSDENILPLGTNTNTNPNSSQYMAALYSVLILFLLLFVFPGTVRRVKPLLTVTFLSGDISLMNNYDDLSPTIIRSGLKGKNRLLPLKLKQIVQSPQQIKDSKHVLHTVQSHQSIKVFDLHKTDLLENAFEV